MRKGELLRQCTIELLDWMRVSPCRDEEWNPQILSPDEVVSCAQAAASLYRAGDEACKEYLRREPKGIGTDGEEIP